MVDFTVERLAEAQHGPGIADMLTRQWLHTGDREIEANPNWALYHQMEARGGLMLVLARQDGRPVGFALAMIYPHPNAVQVLAANIPTYFVEEGPIRALILSRMLDFLIGKLAARGVFKIDGETNAEHSAGRLWELKGFKMSKIGYTLKLKPEAGARYA